MQEKMIRFLNSLYVKQPLDRFDISFEYVHKNEQNPKQVDMIILKETPWDYELLHEFQEALLTAQYPIDLKFNYVNSPSVFDAVSLFNSWYLSIYKITPEFEVKGKDKSTITISFSDSKLEERATRICKDFSDFLKWINYDFSVEKVFNQVESINLEEKISDELASIESKLVDQMDGQERIYKAQLEKDRVFKKGNYRPLDSISQIDEVGLISVDFEAETYGGDIRLLKTGKSMLTIGLGDTTGAIEGKAFESKLLTVDYLEKFVFVPKDPKSYRVRVRGAIEVNSYTKKKDIMIHYLDILPDKFERDDYEEVKRVELHLHSKMSAFDGCSDMTKYCKLAQHFGMDAIAITDHGVCQGFPEAQKAAKACGLKAIYGVELYMFDLQQKYILNPAPTPLNDATYCVFDFETTGLSKTYDRITEFGGVLVKNGIILKSLDFFVNPGMKIPPRISKKTHITDEMVATGSSEEEAIQKIAEFMGDAILVAHNATFDVGFLNEARSRHGIEPIKNPVIDTLPLSHYFFPESTYHNLGALSRNLGLNSYNSDEAHRADFDASALNDCWTALIGKLDKTKPGITHADLQDLKSENPEMFKHLKTRHCVVLAKNKAGLSAVYKLVSESHVTYLSKIPMTPRTLIEENRENLFVGSACFNGEVFDVAKTGNRKELLEVMKFYDYIEIQPLENYSFLVNTEEVTQERLLDILKEIVSAAEELGKPIVATGDAHYAEESDKFYRDIIIDTLAIGEGHHPLYLYHPEEFKPFENPSQHFRTTGEMLDSFEEWMSKEKAYEVVVTNTRKIADQIEPLEPIIENTTFAPNANLPNSAEQLKTLVYDNFYKKYGPNPNPDIKARLDREVNCIVTAGYSVTYYIAHRIIKKTNEDGYIVGSRGSVGSSFAATMAEITEVNPLKPHYFCPKCKHFEFADESLGYKSGFDLPDKVCPECGTLMEADGQNIPFETFLGFNGDKVPDIDLNFPSDYQSRAHDYTRELLGAHNVFRAGTIETVASKTAYGYVMKYIEDHHLDPALYNSERVAFIASKLLKIKRTTGQHPGGIVVVPADYNVYDFTAIQHPADDREADWLTTHFDFNSMHDELLKLDLLGHVDPLAMRTMSILTGIKIEDIPLNDKRVISLFNSPDELKLSENYLGLETGAVGLPEFGTDLAQRMLIATRPKTFNDLLIISGLAHGTNVWSNNAEDLINNGVATLQEVIGCRDDIMTYLISLGIEKLTAFKIMEDIRKGRKLKPEYEDLLKQHNVPDYYITSCNKIKYLFPRGHATAYVTMAVRVGYFKLYYPLEYYATYFSVRCDAWDIASMKNGENAVKEKLNEFKRRSMSRNEEPLSAKEKEVDKNLKVALEMIERGYSFGNVDLYKSDAKFFLVDKENKRLIPPFIVLDGLGEAAGQSVVDARKDGEFLSKEDLGKRTKLSSTNIADLTKLGALDGLNDSNQMSLFDMSNWA